MIQFYDLALPINFAQLLTYSIEIEEQNIDLIGRRALVPLGNRVVTGFIVAKSKIDGSNKTVKVKPIIELLDSEPIFSSAMLEFTKWIADYYLCNWGETLKAAIPQEMNPKSLIKVAIASDISESTIERIAKKAPKRAKLLKLLMKHNDEISIHYLEKELNSKVISSQLEFLKAEGWLSYSKVIEGDSKVKTQKAVFVPDLIFNDDTKIKAIFDELDKKAYKQSVLLANVLLHQKNENQPQIVSEIIKATDSSHNTVNSLIEKGYLEAIDIEINRANLNSSNSLSKRNEFLLELTNEQKVATDFVLNSMKSKTKKPILLFGVTGSGKTLIYIHSIKAALEQNQTAILMVPEISITPQLLDRFNRVFPEQIVAMHSRMSPGERADAWRNVYRGKAKIVIGPRSAIFAPMRNLGLIIIDEEHDSSYKQQAPVPRYNGRDSAIMRGKIEDALVLLGSATPSIETMYNAKVGKYDLLTIKTRADGAKMPEIVIIDTANARKTGQITGNFSKELLFNIFEKLEKKEGVILLQNRRGFASFMMCSACGSIPMCKHCSVSLTYHKSSKQLRCHYCGYTIYASKSCLECGSNSLKEVGTGTQRIEDELKYLLKDFPDAVIQRMDLDTTRKKNAHRKILENFASGKIDILLGTQMVSKGLDFDRVTLVGILNADLQLFLPDFRACEHSFQLITQVSGRAGRSSEKPGKVVIQSSQPDNPAIRLAILADYVQFYNYEISNRQKANYPPFSRFVIIEFESENFELCEEHSETFRKLLPNQNQTLDILGPTTPSIERLKNYYRRLIIIKNIKSKDRAGNVLRTVLKSALAEYNFKYANPKVKISIDIDSYSSI